MNQWIDVLSAMWSGMNIPSTQPRNKQHTVEYSLRRNIASKDGCVSALVSGAKHRAAKMASLPALSVERAPASHQGFFGARKLIRTSLVVNTIRGEERDESTVHTMRLWIDNVCSSSCLKHSNTNHRHTHGGEGKSRGRGEVERESVRGRNQWVRREEEKQRNGKRKD